MVSCNTLVVAVRSTDSTFSFRCSSSNYIPRVAELVQHGHAEQEC